MKKLSIVITILLLAGWAFAQNGERVRQELEQTDEVIATVRPVVEQSGNERAQQLFNNAVEMQQQAWQLFNSNRYRAAMELTMKARQRAREAAGLVNINPERVRAEIQRIAQWMEEIRQTVRQSNEPRALEFWRMAESELAAAREHFAQERYGLALKFARAAERHAQAAWAIVQGRIEPERVRAEIARTENLLERVREELRQHPNRRAQEMLSKAYSWQEQARNAFANRRYGLALRLTLSARDLGMRAWEMIRGRLTPEMVERALAETDRLISDWSEIIRAQGPKPAQVLLDQAIEHQAKARRFFEAGNLQAAFAQTTVARRLIKQAIELTKPDEPTIDRSRGADNREE